MSTDNSAETGLYRLANWVATHWLAVINGIVALYVLFAFIAPLLLSAGWQRPANFLYRIYSPLCHQMAFRSVFIGGDQTVYPRAHAHTLVTLDSFESYAAGEAAFDGIALDGLENELMFSARAFTGSELMGYKSAVCQRDLMIFGFFLIGGLLYGFLRARGIKIRPMPILLFILIGILPIALDGFSQLFSYYIPVLAFRESPPYLRLGTGALFGFCAAWLVFPFLDGQSRHG